MAVTTETLVSSRLSEKWKVFDLAMDYKYERLENDGDIRLLELQPGKSLTDILRCTLRICNVNHAQFHQQYETVSYHWGDKSQTEPLLLDGIPVKIPKSAAAALKQVRKADGPRVLFLDVLCINQSDLDERAQQVLIMGDIYKNSKGNLVFLGPEQGYTSAAANSIDVLFQEMSDETEGFKTLWSTVADKDKRNACRSKVGFSRREEIDFDALENFFGQDWFRRLWVTLETLVAPTNECLSGTYSWRLVDLLRVSAWLHYKSFHVGLFVPNIINNRLWTWWVAIDPETEPVSGQCGGFQTFFQLLSFASSRETSDEKDRVFALQSLFQDKLPRSLLPDYRRPLVDLMCEATRQAFINEDGKIDMNAIHHVRHTSNAELESGIFPSWVPDWAHYHNDPGTLPESFRAGSGSPLAPSLFKDSTDPRELRLYGTIAGRITSVSTSLSDETFKDADKLRHWLEGLIEQFNAARLSAVFSASVGHGADSEETDIDALIRCLQAGQTPHAGAPLDDHPRATHLYDELWLYAIERLVFSTDSGYLGLGPALSRKDDILVVVQGCPWPLVLRPCDDRYWLIGECHVPGIMYGEAFEAGDGIEGFVIR